MWTHAQKATMAIAQKQLNEKSGGQYSREDFLGDISKIVGFEITSRTDKRLNYQHFKQVLNFCTSRGFVQISKREEPPLPDDNHVPYYDNSDLEGRDPEWANKKQVDKVCEMWRVVTKHPEKWEQTLNSFLKSKFNIDDYKWIKYHRAKNIIDTIKEMYLRKVLKNATTRRYPGNKITENKLIELYRLLYAGFTREELAAALSVAIANDAEMLDTLKSTKAVCNEMNYHKLTGVHNE